MNLGLHKDHASMNTYITRHLVWLESTKRRSTRTVQERRKILQKADRELPDGIEDADEDQLAAWFHQFTRPGAEWTLATYDAALRVFYTWGVRYGVLTLDPMVDIERPPPGPRIPHPCEDHELATALTATRWPWGRGVMLGAYAGLRCMEICSVTTDDVVDGHLIVRGKGKRVRTVPIGPQLADELLIEPEHAEPVTDARGRPMNYLVVGARGRPMDPRILTQMQRPVWQTLGLPDSFSLHSLRHWYATRLIEAGADLPTVQELMGHASVTTTMNYLAVTSKRKLKAANSLPTIGGQIEPGDSRLDLPPAA